jgi:bifunctional NMN adenylyltransferase/nudix hydrolase
VYNRLCEEHASVKAYKARWATAPFPPIFVTVDNIVICKGHILLIKRGHNPGKGKWALPGGFVEQTETLKTAAIRELKEETRIDVDKLILENSLKAVKVIDAVFRDERGRAISHTHLFELRIKTLPHVQADDDADHVQWIPFADIDKMQSQFAFDHFHIIKSML